MAGTVVMPGLFGSIAALIAPKSLMAWQQPAGQSAPPPAPASDQAQFATGVKVVNVFVVVRDKQGQAVQGLTANDFMLDEDGHAQVIRYFARQSDLPLTLGLLVDTSASVRNVLDEERRASYQFFEHVLREDKDKAFVIHFDREVELLQDLTSSRADLEKALRDLNAERPQLNRRSQGGNSGGGNSGNGYPQGGGGYPGGGGGGRRAGTTLYDSILLASNELMKKQPNRKALILMSDGEDNGSKVSLGEAIESAQRADTAVYSIRFFDEDANRPTGFGGGGFGGGIGGVGMGRRGGGGRRMPTQERPDGKKILQQISRETGGEYFDVTKKMPLEKIFDRIEEDLRNQYSLGYTSNQTEGGYYRKIHVTAKDKNVTVQARDGYYPATS